jgi:hypothetical protein
VNDNVMHVVLGTLVRDRDCLSRHCVKSGGRPIPKSGGGPRRSRAADRE